MNKIIKTSTDADTPSPVIRSELATFAETLVSIRKIRRMSQTDLAKITGLEPSAISHFECGRRHPHFSNLLLLANALNVSVDVLLGKKPDRQGRIVTPSPVLGWIEGAISALELARIEIVTGCDCGRSLDNAALKVKEARGAREYFEPRQAAVAP